MRDDLISQRYLFAKKYLFIHDIDRDRSSKTEEGKYLLVNNTTPTVYCEIISEHEKDVSHNKISKTHSQL